MGQGWGSSREGREASGWFAWPKHGGEGFKHVSLVWGQKM